MIVFAAPANRIFAFRRGRFKQINRFGITKIGKPRGCCFQCIVRQFDPEDAGLFAEGTAGERGCAQIAEQSECLSDGEVSGFQPRFANAKNEQALILIFHPIPQPLHQPFVAAPVLQHLDVQFQKDF